MSQSYPSKGENNMDHVTYFRSVIGFHSTVFGLYSKLGTRDSHGCVRLARPQARKVYALIRYNGSAATIISRQSGEPDSRELDLIKKMLAKDLNFIQSLIAKQNRADVPFNESDYFKYLSNQLDRNYIEQRMRTYQMKSITELPRDQDLGPFAAPPVAAPLA